MTKFHIYANIWSTCPQGIQHNPHYFANARETRNVHVCAPGHHCPQDGPLSAECLKTRRRRRGPNRPRRSMEESEVFGIKAHSELERRPQNRHTGRRQRCCTLVHRRNQHRQRHQHSWGARTVMDVAPYFFYEQCSFFLIYKL